MRIEQFQLYEDDPKVTLTAYILDDSPEMLNGAKRPAVLVCPGGAYMFTSDREADPVAIRFAAILGNRPGHPLKPSPEIVEEVLALSGVSKADALLIGDSPTDMHTAENGGIDALAVGWGYRTHAELAGYPIVDSVEELRRVLWKDSE